MRMVPIIRINRDPLEAEIQNDNVSNGNQQKSFISTPSRPNLVLGIILV